MGEIGVPRLEYLYELSYWEILLITRGYSRRSREIWSAIRWSTYCIMSTSMADLKKAGIRSPKDLLPFPWDSTDEEVGDQPTPEVVASLRKMMAEENAKNQQ